MEINLNLDIISSFEKKIFLDPRVEIKTHYKKKKKMYFQINCRMFEETYESIRFVYTLLYYFTNKDNFSKSSLLYEYTSTNINLNKSLIIIGGVGTGKTSVLKTLRAMINQNPQLNLKFMTTKDVVSEYESTLQEDLFDFFDKLNNGNLIIDDLMSESIASRFGKKELFEDILFKRCENNKIITLITMNYLEEFPNNADEAILELYQRYGQRVFDRILGNFNFIILKDKSFRKW